MSKANASMSMLPNQGQKARLSTTRKLKGLFHRKDRTVNQTTESESQHRVLEQPSPSPTLSLRTENTDSRVLALNRDDQSSTATSLHPNVPSVGRRNYHDAIIMHVLGSPPAMGGRHCQAPWYINRPKRDEEDRSIYGLCANCQHIDFEYLFLDSRTQITADPEDYIRLGPMAEISRQMSCPFCVLVANTVNKNLERDAEGNIVLTADARRLLSANWYLTPFVYSHEQYGPGFQLFLCPNVRETDGDPLSAAKIKHLSPDWPYAVRLLYASSRGGRRIPTNHLDYEWIRSTFELCDKSTDRPPRRFIHRLRAIDTYDMSIDDLPAESDYIALSYCWGKTQMLTLSKQNHSFLRSSGSLTSSPFVPQTIRDAIVLVRSVGKRYLWVDSLCVVQDDPSDMNEQLQQMGEVYRHSYFTIFAISGRDVDHGLPGVRWGSRRLTQVIRHIGNLTVASSLPWMEEEELVQAGAWGSRAWTFQERFRAQRGLFVGDKGIIINCLHTYSPEDEYCMHTLERAPTDGFIATGDTVFYSGQHKSCTPYIRNATSFDMYVMLISEYSQRQLTFQSDAERACLAILSYLKDKLNCNLMHGMPDTEFDAALLWSPIGASVRRIDEITGKAQFPSWSWLGWQGHAAWPWQLDRDTFTTTWTTPITWRDASSDHSSDSSATEIEEWFTPEELCLPLSPHRGAILKALMKIFPDHLGLRMLCDRARVIHPEWLSKYQIDWPDNIAPAFQYNLPPSHKLTLSTSSAVLYVIGKPFQRSKPYNVQHPIWRLSVIDEEACLAGYIDIPDPSTSKIQLGPRLFVALSRSTIDGNIEPGPEALDKTPSRRKPRMPFTWQTDRRHQGGMDTRRDVENYQHKTPATALNPTGNFDTRVYPTDRPWCMFNVMMLRKAGSQPRSQELESVPDSCDLRGSVYEREAIGRIHVDAFDAFRRKETFELV